MNKSVIGGIVVLVVVLAGGGILLAKNSSSDDEATDTTMNMSQDTTKPANTAEPSTKDAIETDSVVIKDYAFNPFSIRVKVGTKVTWTNQDSVGHTVTDDGAGAGLDSKVLQKGESYSFTFTKTGTFSYLCTPHPYMKASVTVVD